MKMRIRVNKKQAALLVGIGLGVLCALNAAAAGAKPAQTAATKALGSYVLQRTEDTADAATLHYKSAAGLQMTVTYERGGKASSRGLRQYLAQPMLYACYSDQFTSEKISTVYYTVGSCTVTVCSLDEKGNVAALNKDDMLAFLNQLQQSAMPVAVGTCEKCGGELYSQGASVSDWKKLSGGPCGHGGGLKNTDTKQERTIKLHTVCADCARTQEQTTTQTGTYCSYSGSWQMN
jgi:hypothetical protein